VLKSKSTFPDVPYAKLNPELWLSIPKILNFQAAQLTGTTSGLGGRLLCTLVPVVKAVDKNSNHQARALRPSDLLHSSSATVEAHATTLLTPTHSG
jgi:hypothetical protein